ncbi:hypothetical protein B566_EDAN014810 [Ephemera danica]|nr:hypothetical protein B566_EDAN014810 [Ephemera danica]
MLRCSPVLALYAQLLLLAQYVYSLDLSAEELPEEVDWVNLRQIGLIKPASLPVKPLIVKFMQERWEAKHSSALVEGVAEPFNITVSTTAGGLTSELSTGAATEAPQATGSTVLARLGAWLQSLLTKFWIWVVAIMLFVIGLGSGQVVLYRILSYRVWRVMMYGFWLTVIVYSMLVLVLIYTYQFDNFPDYWHNYTGIPLQLVLSEADPESALTSLAVSLPTEPHKKPDKLEIVHVQEHPITPKDLSYEAIRTT